MGIKLDWQVESEQSHLRATEDPAVVRARQHARRRLIALLIGLVSVLGLVGMGIVWRLRSVDDQFRQDLIDTVEIEVTALRLGDLPNFMAIQRSASDTFLLEQSRRFDDYQALKQTRRVELTGEILSVTIDDQRGRVIVQEIIDGVPYKVVWFYWYYEDGDVSDQGGWRHVPDDLTFWGAEREITQDNVRITYRTLDSALAQSLAPRLDTWLDEGCTLAGCVDGVPSLHVDIVAERPATVEWATYDAWTLRVSSPLVGRTRADTALAPDLAHEVAAQVAARLVRYAAGNLILPAASDAAWMEADLARWLAHQLLGGAAAAPGFTESLIAQYGPGAPLTVVDTLRRGAGTLDGVISALAGVSMPLLSTDQLNALRWVEFFQWRLALEPDLLAQSDGGAFVSLYDQDNPFAAGEAAARLQNADYAARPVPQITSVSISRDAESQTYAYAETTRLENGVTVPGDTIIWRLTGGTWKRLN